MPEPPASPRAHRLAAPRWLDTRLVLGVLLVLTSVLVGARILSAADRSTLVWAAARDVAPGTVLTGEDFTPQQVRLFDPAQRARYISAEDGQPPVDYVARVSLAAGDLVPASALVDLSADTPLRQVTVQVGSGHAPPDLRGGQQVDVYVTPGAGEAVGGAASPGNAAPRLVLAGLSVQSVPAEGGFGADDSRAVVLNVPPQQVLPLVSAVAEGRIDLVRVRSGDEVQPAADSAPAGAARAQATDAGRTSDEGAG